MKYHLPSYEQQARNIKAYKDGQKVDAKLEEAVAETMLHYVPKPFELGAKVRYWPKGMAKPYFSVEVLGYTKTGRVRIKFVTSGYKCVVKANRLSVI